VRASPTAEVKPIRVNARVLESLPGALYAVELESRPRSRVTAHVSGESELLRVLPGESVVVEIAHFDASRGRIVGRR
jgi:translation initiation factor IF-1